MELPFRLTIRKAQGFLVACRLNRYLVHLHGYHQLVGQ
jgi:hypothetical protein